jgi:hypothetical protein
VIDWTTGQPVPGALVEAVLQPDSLPYRISADSAGNFVGAPLPAGNYVVFGAIDQNRNGRRETREAYDSVTATGNGPPIAIWTFPHDTNPPRLQQATPRDTVTVELQFSQPLSPDQRIDTGLVTVRHLPDSAVVPVAALATQQVYDSMRQAVRPDSLQPDSLRPDSLAPVAPPAARPPGVRPARDSTLGRPTLSDRLILVLQAPMDTAGQYLVLVDSIRNVTGVSGSTRGVFSAPKPAAPLVRPDSAGVDSLPPDSLRPDSLPADSVPE